MQDGTFRVENKCQFDLSKGVATSDNAQSLVLVPATVLTRMIAELPADAAAKCLRAFGQELGDRGRARLSSPSHVTMENVLGELAVEFAAAGLGMLSFERWGRALVVVLSHGPLQGTSAAALVEGAMSGISGRAVVGARLFDEGGLTRVLLTSQKGADRVAELLKNGMSWGHALTELQKGSAS